MTSHPDVIVIGAGMGGLSTAAFLLKRGLRPLVLEHHYQAGGYVSAFKRRGYVFDCAVDAVAGLGPDGLLDRLLADLGVRPEVEVLPLDPVRETHFPGFSAVVAPAMEDYREFLASCWPADETAIAAFFEDIERIYTCVLKRFDDGPHVQASEADLALVRKAGSATWGELLGEYFECPNLKVVLSDRCQYLGLPPSRLSAMQAAMAMVSYFRQGASRVKGGSQVLADALVRGVRRRGGEVRLACGVREILARDGTAAGVVTDQGEEIRARAVVSTADPVQTARLLGVKAAALDQRPAVSFFLVYLGAALEENTLPASSSIGVFPTWNVDRALDPEDPFGPEAAFGITIPTRVDPGLAPSGRQVVILHKEVAYGFADDWGGRREALAREMIAKAERFVPGLERGIEVMEIATPLTLERYTRNLRGSAYGWEQVPHRRPAMSPVDGLHFAGHWTSAGGGVLAAAYSGLLAARSVEASLGRLAKRV
ncbi:MAG: NAD(P)/FAD-dependent oxidoreductase [Nitrospirae bacterium]|nr:NAD(P)/FAD-dependent oxidoreductase [Nitrospirota bacterium]MBI3392660.1 NAD(P)/FAD-dependent oxidoreductase [Nitrospirota bacterium]